MNARPFSVLTDYQEISQWWEAQKWPVIPTSMLPANGYIVPGHAVAFLYKTDSGFGILEWCLVNPAADKEARRAALDEVISCLVVRAKEIGVQSIFTSTDHKGLIERYQKQGFLVTDKGMTNMIRRIS